MMRVSELEFNEKGELVALKGTATVQGKKLRCAKYISKEKDLFSWESVGLEYCGG